MTPMLFVVVGLSAVAVAVLVVVVLSRRRAQMSLDSERARTERILAQHDARTGAGRAIAPVLGAVSSIAGAVVGAFNPPAGAAIVAGGNLLASEIA